MRWGILLGSDPQIFTPICANGKLGNLQVPRLVPSVCHGRTIGPPERGAVSRYEDLKEWCTKRGRDN